MEPPTRAARSETVFPGVFIRDARSNNTTPPEFQELCSQIEYSQRGRERKRVHRSVFARSRLRAVTANELEPEVHRVPRQKEACNMISAWLSIVQAPKKGKRFALGSSLVLSDRHRQLLPACRRRLTPSAVSCSSRENKPFH